MDLKINIIKYHMLKLEKKLQTVLLYNLVDYINNFIIFIHL